MLKYEEYVNYVREKHAGQLRKHGTPYYTHPVAVSEILKEKGFPYDYRVAGLFHDLIEDTDVTYEELGRISNHEIAETVRLLTKEKNYQMSEYIDRISKNAMAKMVKLADRVHNLSEASLAGKVFVEKYVKETEDWYVSLAKGTVFEEDINRLLRELKGENIEDCKYYLILKNRLMCHLNNKTFEYINGKWESTSYNEILGRLIGFDPTEPKNSPYAMGNGDIMAEIEEITKEQVVEKYGTDIIDDLKKLMQ